MTEINRRQLMAGTAALAAASALPRWAGAATGPGGYPTRPIRFIIPFAPGGGADFLGRLVTDKLRARWGQQLVIENMGGAASNIGVAALAKAPADGYTLGMINTPSHAINPALYKERLPFDPAKDFAPISPLGITPNVLTVNPKKIPVDSLQGFVDYLKANPGKVNYGSSGPGSTLHLGMELFCQATGTKMTHVPYKGSGPMLNDLLAGHIDCSLDAAVVVWPHVEAGTLRVLAVSTPQRAFFAPNLPALNEFYKGLEVTAWHGMAAPAGTPKELVEWISSEVRTVLALPEVKEQFDRGKVVAYPMTPDEFTAMIKAERERWTPVVLASGVTVE